MPAPPCAAQHFPGVLHHCGGELLGAGGGSPGDESEEDCVVVLVEGAALNGSVLHARQYLLERPAFSED